jgi:curved DNA-binding protein CbpA
LQNYNAEHLSLLDEKKEYYAILGASEDASPAEIDRLYKRLAHKRHPDRGGDEEDMKMLNEAYRVLRDDVSRSKYDSQRRERTSNVTPIAVTPTARDVGASGQLLSALLCLVLGVMLLLLVRFNGLWFLWPLSILALGVILFGVMIAHSAMTNARNSFAAAHPVRRFRAAQEIVFWSLVFSGGIGLYLILTTV